MEEIKLPGCPECHSINVVEDSDGAGTWVVCLNCWHKWDGISRDRPLPANVKHRVFGPQGNGTRRVGWRY